MLVSCCVLFRTDMELRLDGRFLHCRDTASLSWDILLDTRVGLQLLGDMKGPKSH